MIQTSSNFISISRFHLLFLRWRGFPCTRMHKVKCWRQVDDGGVVVVFKHHIHVRTHSLSKVSDSLPFRFSVLLAGDWNPESPNLLRYPSRFCHYVNLAVEKGAKNGHSGGGCGAVGCGKRDEMAFTCHKMRTWNWIQDLKSGLAINT